MHFLRQALSIAAIVFLPIFLFLFGLLFGLYQVFGSADSIKSALEQSRAYDTFVQDALNALQHPEQEGEEDNKEEQKREGLPLDDQKVQRIISEAIPPQYLKEQTTGFLDAIYAWVRGETEQVKFTVDLKRAKSQLANGLANYAGERFSTLPVCTEPPTSMESEAFDIFNMDCVPPGTDKAALVNQVRQEINNIEFLEDPVITEKDLAGDDGRSPELQLQNLRNAYNGLKAAVYITGIASILLMAGAILLAPHWRNGLRRTGIVAIVVGAVSALIAWAGAFLAQQLGANLADGAIQETITSVISLLAADVRNWWLGYGLILAALGVAALVALHFIKSPQQSESAEKEEPKAKNESPDADKPSGEKESATGSSAEKKK